MNELMIFEGKQGVEVFEFDGKVLFNPYHVGECLELSKSAVQNHMANMNDNQKVKLTNSALRDKGCRKFNNFGETFLTKPGVYKLILRSRAPKAEKFQNWICDEVLPALNHTGQYSIANVSQTFQIRTKAQQEENRENIEALLEHKLYHGSHSAFNEAFSRRQVNARTLLEDGVDLIHETKTENGFLNARHPDLIPIYEDIRRYVTVCCDLDDTNLSEFLTKKQVNARIDKMLDSYLLYTTLETPGIKTTRRISLFREYIIQHFCTHIFRTTWNVHIKPKENHCELAQNKALE